MRKRHVDRWCHRRDIARSLGQHVPALEGAHEPGRELVDRRDWAFAGRANNR
jgi:hypothetical protein